MGVRLERVCFGAVAAVLAAVSAYLLFANLGARAWQVDEPVYRNAARAYLEYGNFTHNLEHPMLGKYLIGASEAVFGLEPWATRLPSAIGALLAGTFLGMLGWGIGRAMAAQRTDRAGAASARFSERAAAATAGATAATWLLLPHPSPEFDVTRLAYLDAMMAAFIAAALAAGWRWSRTFGFGWAVFTGIAAGCAVATKFPALFLVVPLGLLVAFPSVVALRRRLASFAILCVASASVVAATYLPLAGDLPRALRFAAAMQARDVDQQLELAGRSYESPPVWTQAWWQWDSMPAFALVQLVALVLVFAVVPRRAATYLAAATLTPLLAYALLGGRILPHWQVTWQVGASAMVGAVAVAVFVRASAANGWRRRASIVVGVTMLAVVLAYAGQRVLDVREEGGYRVGDVEVPPGMRSPAIDDYLAVADRPDKIVIDLAGQRVQRSLSYAHPWRWDGTYHSAAEAQHTWSTRRGGRPLEPTPAELAAEDLRVGDVTAILLEPGDAGRDRLPIADDLLVNHFVRHEVDGVVVWLNNDLRAPQFPGE